MGDSNPPKLMGKNHVLHQFSFHPSMHPAGFKNLNLLNNCMTNITRIECFHCGKIFERPTTVVNYRKNKVKLTNSFCSKKCHHLNRTKILTIECANCTKIVQKNQNEFLKSKSGRCFCSHKCSASYNNTHKTKGTRRSKLEVYLEEQLTLLYPDLEIRYCEKEHINSELDIYIPSLKLAFELNGIFHYEPIYGKEKLEQIENNDSRKMQACLEKGIELCIIDSSGLKYFKPANAQKYLDIVVNTINKKWI